MSFGEGPLWQVFVRPRRGVSHHHVGSVHAHDEEQALQSARDLFTRRGEGQSLWIVRSDHVVASDPDDEGELFDPALDKEFRHARAHPLPDDVDHM
ncbi:MAG: 1,2-phenylacetyl-CoA epoxidase subunit PaaB [Acidobacteriota bacterium]